MKVVVTGANGYIGGHVVKKLLSDSHQVLSVNSNSVKSYGYDGYKENVSIFSNSESIFDDLGRPDLCIHLAWKDGFIHNSRKHMEYLSSHTRFLFDLIDGGIKSLSVLGTMHEIGYHVGAVTAETPCKPRSQYGIAKNALRDAVFDYNGSRCSLKWLRAFYIMGDEAHTKNIFSKISEAEENGKDSFPFTSGKNMFDFIDVDVLASQICAASLQLKYEGIINVCSGQPQEISNVVENFIKSKNYRISLDYGAFPDRPYDSPCVYGDSTIIDKIMSELH